MNKKQKRELVKIFISLIFLALAIFLPIENIYKLILFAIAYIIVGFDVLLSAFRNIISGQIFNEKLLMSIATLGAFAIKEYPEAAAVMLFYKIGELFESLAVGKSRKSIAALMDIRPKTAVVLRKGVEITVYPEEVEIGEIFIVKAGEKIPLDGIILEGETSVDLSSLTGESMPSYKSVGDTVLSGSVNLNGVLKVKAVNRYEDSTVAKILNLVENTTAKKAKTENFITRFAKFYTPIVVISAFILAVLPPLLLKQNWSEWINRALIFLVVSCPCALVVSVPLSFFGGIGGASRQGILIKGAVNLEALTKVKTFVFDKTGTLTKGSFSITDIYSKDNKPQKLLEIAASAEGYSSHPVAVCIKSAANSSLKVSSVKEISGLGLEAVIEGETYYIGNSALLDREKIKFEASSLGGTVIYIAKKNEYLGFIKIDDELKGETKSALEMLKKLGIKKTVMLTGDNETVAKKVAEEILIDDYYANLLPNQKVTIVEKLLGKGGVAFVGDGINDAPVLARADVGVAMGALGSDAAIEAADVVIMDDKLSKLSSAVLIARKTMRIVKQNIIFALSVKAVILILGALGIANMWLAVFGDVGVTVIAILNSLRALKK